MTKRQLIGIILQADLMTNVGMAVGFAATGQVRSGFAAWGMALACYIVLRQMDYHFKD